MKFANKLFFIMTAVLTVIFAIFGTWMLSANFSKTIDREMERANAESGMFQMMFQKTYFSLIDYGNGYAIGKTMDSISSGIEKNGNACMVWTEKKEYYRNINISVEEAEELAIIAQGFYTSPIYQQDEEANYRATIRQIGDRYYILTVCQFHVVEGSVSDTVYLGMCRDITALYETRNQQITQYCIALLFLLITGGACIYFLSRYITRPIRDLNGVVGEISEGNYEKRCQVVGEDEISELAKNFNVMADHMVQHMHEKELEALQKESFTTAFAHELKTPLTSIIGYADMLNSVDMTEQERREAYYYIYSQGKRLESLSHKLLELAEIDKNPLKKKSISTKELEDNLRATMRPIFNAKKIKGKIIMEKGILNVDKELILTVFYNVLDNAVKAVEEGGFVLLKGTRLADGYEVKVMDDGRGIPEGEIHRITEAFYMVDKSRSRKEGGAGIGMALCQKIMILHGGEIGIHSKLGEGTIVQLLFPDEGVKE